MTRFVVLHGLGGSGPDHWQSWLVGRLQSAGEEVAYPDLPDSSDPHPDAWETAANGEVGRAPDSVVVCHSLACLLWLRLAARSDPRLAERVLLVSPPCAEEVPAIGRFLDHGATAADVKRAATATLLVCSEDDPYCPPGAIATFAEPLGIESRTIPGAGHINPETDYGSWPDVETWAVTGRWP